MEKRTLCVHVKRLLSGNIPEEDLQPWIGRTSNMTDSTFLEWSKEVSSLFALALQGRIDEIDQQQFSHIALRSNTERLTVNGGGKTCTPSVVPRDVVLKRLLTLDGTSMHAQKIWAGMMKLKTAVPPRTSRMPSRKQLDDHYHSIVDPFNGDDTVFEEVEQQIRTLTQMIVKQSRVNPAMEEEFYLPMHAHPSREKKFTSVLKESTTRTISRRLQGAYDLQGFLGLEEVKSIYRQDPLTFISRMFVGTTVDEGSFDIDRYKTISKGSTALGTISYIPKAGDKERVVTIPTAGMQSLSYPIGKILRILLDSWNVQGVKSHEQTCEYISNMIRVSDHKTFYSIDMSNFTDRFPYDGFQSIIVDELVNLHVLKPVDKTICDLIAHGAILVNGQIRSYGVGTPMGTFPSFPLASLGNGIAAAISFANAHLDGDVRRISLNHLPTRVIGDDFVTWDTGLASHYKELMTRLGVEIQPSKCMESQACAEMCSKIITDLGVFQQKKLETLASAESLTSFMSQLEYYGPDLISELAIDDPEFAQRLEALYLVPRPFGLGPSIDEQDYGPLSNFYKAAEIGHEVTSVTQEPLNGRDLQILDLRKQAYPKDLTFKVGLQAHNDPFAITAIQESIESSILLLHKRIMEPKLSLKERDELSQVIIGYANMLSHLADEYAFLQRKKHLEYHLEDPSLIFDEKNDTLRRDVDKQLNKLVDITVDLQNSQKGDFEDGYELE